MLLRNCVSSILSSLFISIAPRLALRYFKQSLAARAHKIKTISINPGDSYASSTEPRLFAIAQSRHDSRSTKRRAPSFRETQVAACNADNQANFPKMIQTPRRFHFPKHPAAVERLHPSTPGPPPHLPTTRSRRSISHQSLKPRQHAHQHLRIDHTKGQPVTLAEPALGPLPVLRLSPAAITKLHAFAEVSPRVARLPSAPRRQRRSVQALEPYRHRRQRADRLRCDACQWSNLAGRAPLSQRSQRRGPV